MRNIMPEYNKLTQHLQSPNYMTAVTQLFSLKLPSDLVSIWSHTKAISGPKHSLFSACDARLYLSECLNTNKATYASQRDKFPSLLESASSFQLKSSSLLGDPLQKETKRLFLGTIANCSVAMWRWQHVNLLTYKWLVYRYCAPVTWEIQMKIPGYILKTVERAPWFTASCVPGHTSGFPASFSAVSPQDCLVIRDYCPVTSKLMGKREGMKA